jgi:hypothetical protein
VRNRFKESVKGFAEVHVWVSEECFSMLKQLHDQHPEAHVKIRIHGVGSRKFGQGAP